MIQSENEEKIITEQKNTNKDKIINEEIEIQLLLEAINMKYGYDFRNYSTVHIKRRIRYRMSLQG